MILKKAIKCSILLNKYSQYFLTEDDNVREKLMDLIAMNIENEMLFVFDYTMEINHALMQYGDGPIFAKEKILCTEPMSI